MIEVTNLTKAYGETLAVDDLTFTIRPGIVTGFLGPNGAGKSTTMRMILGLDAPTSGTATVDGRPLAEHPLPLRSMGALLGDPQVVMLDEPVNGLDPEGIQWIRNLLQDLAREGRTVFVSSHLMSEMELMAEHYVIIGRGRLIQDISADGLRAMADSNTTHVSADRLDDLVGLLRADGVTIDSADRGRVSVTGLDPEEIGVIARDHGIALTSLARDRRSLEDVFLVLTAGAVEYHGHGTAGSNQAAIAA